MARTTLKRPDDRTHYYNKLASVPQLSGEERRALDAVVERYSFRANDYYLGLIDWDDPEDPIRRIVIPTLDELEDWGRLDASDEHLYKRVPGLEHKYEFTAVLLVNDVCGGICRFCFRKRLFMDQNEEVARDVAPGLQYIREHPEINNVLLTGGDPLLLSVRKLDAVLGALRGMDHVQIIRIGTKIPVFDPQRFDREPDLIEVLSRHSWDEKRIYLMVHFNHPRELTPPAVELLGRLQKAGLVLANQTPMLRGVNADPGVLGELFNRLSYVGVAPYYVFLCRPTAGNHHFALPVEEAFDIFEQARMRCSGLAKRARLVMSHTTGKIEVIGRTSSQVFLRYHRSADYDFKARFLVFKSNPDAMWFDDYAEVMEDYAITNPFRVHGPE